MRGIVSGQRGGIHPVDGETDGAITRVLSSFLVRYFLCQIFGGMVLRNCLYELSFYLFFCFRMFAYEYQCIGSYNFAIM